MTNVPHIQRRTFRAMACACETVLAVDNDEQADRLFNRVEAEVHRIEAKYSRYRADSVLSRINATAGGPPQPCDSETLSLLDHADHLHRASDGHFDITSGVLRRAWDFRLGRRPSAEALAPVLALVGWSRVERDGARVRLTLPGMELDFGGLGKEYAADRAGALLEQDGARHGYVNLGGDLRVIGPRPDGRPWQVGIQDPRRRDGVLATMPIDRGALATSGDYERCFEQDGQRFCHLLDPASGQPVTHWRSVSVCAPLAVLAGSCSTIAMLLQGRGLDFLESTGLDYLAVDHQGTVHLKGTAVH